MYFHNGHILTFNPAHPEATAMTVEGGTVHTVDTTSGGVAHDFDRHVVMPGFNDAHVHIWKLGQLAAYIIDLRGIRSIAEIQRAVQAKAKQLPAGTWIVGRGFNEQVLADKRMPLKEDLDAATAQHPVYLIRTCAHIAAVNSLALQQCQITDTTPAPAGGVVGHHDDGSLTGIFYETALGLVTRHMPPPTRAEYKDMIRKGASLLVAAGVTSATDPAVHPELLEAYLEVAQELPIRVNCMPILLPDGGAQPFPVPEKFVSDRLRIDTVKFFADGGLSGKTAALKRPYKNSADKGVLRLERESYLALARDAQRKGFRIGTHAIGDEAIGLVLDVYQSLYQEFGPMRSRLEHLGLPEDQHLDIMQAHDFVAVPQPIFLYELGENFASALTDDYLSRCYPVQSLLNRNIPVAFSTDAPVVKELNPWRGVQAAVMRQSSQGTVIAPQEAIKAEQALRLYTEGSAYAEGTEKIKGTLCPGKYADFVVLDRHPLLEPVGQLHEVKVLEVYVGGERVYQA